MKNVVFVGDEPSATNACTEIAFVGAKCFPKLVEWINIINPNYYICLNSNTSELLNTVELLYNNEFKIVALGEKASGRLDKARLSHYRLPHPSGLNRKINDKEYIAEELQKCKKFIDS